MSAAETPPTPTPAAADAPGAGEVLVLRPWRAVILSVIGAVVLLVVFVVPSEAEANTATTSAPTALAAS